MSPGSLTLCGNMSVAVGPLGRNGKAIVEGRRNVRHFLAIVYLVCHNRYQTGMYSYSAKLGILSISRRKVQHGIIRDKKRVISTTNESC